MNRDEVRDDRRYTRDHEWVRPEGDVLLVGITPFVTAEMRRVEQFRFHVRARERIRAGQALACIDCHKVSFDLSSPLSGRVRRVNRALCRDLERIRQDCYEAGWLIALSPADPVEVDRLLDAATYAHWLLRAPPVVED